MSDNLPTSVANAATDSACTLSPSVRRWLIFWMVLGLALRLMAAVLPPAYIDEAFNYALCLQGPATVVKYLAHDVHTPVIQLLGCLVADSQGDIFWLRLPNVFLGVLSIWLAFLLGRRFFSDKGALAVAALTACNYHLWFNDAQFRPYCPLMTFSLALWLGLLDIRVSAIPFVEISFLRERLRWLLFSIICMAVASLHILGAMYLLVAGLWSWVVFSDRVRLKTLKCLAIGLLPCALWFVGTRLAMPHFMNSTSPHILSVFYSWGSMLLYLFDIDVAYAAASLYVCGKMSYLLAWWPRIVGALVVIYWLWRSWRSCVGKSEDIALLLASTVLPLFVLGCASLFCWTRTIQERYAFAVTVPFFILVLSGLGFGKMATWVVRIVVAYSLMLAIVFPGCQALWCQYWQGAIDFIEQTRQPGDIVAVYTGDATASFRMAYDMKQFGIGDDTPSHFIPTPAGAKAQVVTVTNAYMADLISSAQCKRFYLLLCQSGSSGGVLLDALRPHFGLANEYNFDCYYDWGKVQIYELVRYDSSL